MDSKRKRKILVVDDHPLIRSGLTSLINEEPELEVCGETGEISTALKLVEKTSPDLAIIDLTLADGNGLDLIKRLRARNSKVRILVISMHDETLFAERALQAGAMGYVNKHEITGVVIDAIRLVLKGKIYLSESMTERLLMGLVQGKQELSIPTVEDLSNRELEVYELIGEGMSISKIAKQLNLSIKTVETHREKTKKKLHLSNSNEVVRHAMQWFLEQGK
jgi:DNA-binding NarL/FixJ family response regulator